MARQTSYRAQMLARQQREAKQLQDAESRAKREAEKEAGRRDVEEQVAYVDRRNNELDQQVALLSNLLVDSLTKPRFDLSNLKPPLPTIPPVEAVFPEVPPTDPVFPVIPPVEAVFPVIPPFAPGELGRPEPPPSIEAFRVPRLSATQKLLYGVNKKYEQEVAQVAAQYKAAMAAYQTREEARKRALREASVKYEQFVTEARKQALLQAEAKHEQLVAESRKQALLQAKAKHEQLIAKAVMLQRAEVESLRREFASGNPNAISDFCSLVLDASDFPDDFPRFSKVAYVPESKQLVLEYDLPPLEVVPEVGSYKYVKSKDEMTQTSRPAMQRKSLYASVIAQIALRVLFELFDADFPGHLDTIVFNGYVNTIDHSTGRSIRPCLVTVRTTRDVFMQLNLRKVDPAACLRGLSASVSRNPSELEPVKPVLEFNMVDPRFVQESDVLSELDQRKNLMELNPFEFESLITNLFEKMGLETRQTRPSRDGGVDCVAYNTNPILGGKVVIQAKRYKHTVGVSAVRDLYGTLVNEGASKGILITTSGYGKASYEFANGKPLELLSGSNLLHLLAEYAGIEAKIEPPEDWKDPQPDTVSEDE